MSRLWMIILLLALFAGPVASYGETRYVSDVLYISLRANPDPDASLITTLKSDTPLEVLEDNEKFLRVRTPDGTEGYVLSRYVTSALPKSRQIEQLRRERDALEEKVAQLEQELQAGEASQAKPVAELEAKVATLEDQLEEAKRQLAAVRERYQALQKEAADVVAVVNDRDRLQIRNEQLNDEIDTLREQNSDLLRTGMIRWFLAGGGVFLVGWVAGKVSRRKRRTF
jgi:SH3 domain protein